MHHIQVLEAVMLGWHAHVDLDWDEPLARPVLKQVSRPRVLGPGFKAQGSRPRVQGPGFLAQGSWPRVLGPGFTAQGSRPRVLGPGF